MKPTPSLVRLLLTALVLVLLAGVPAKAQEPYVYTIGVMGGVGGSFDEDQAGLGNSSLQLALGILTEKRAHVGLRVGEITYDATDQLGLLTDPSISWITLAGEYRYPDAYYESGLFVGLGAYRIEGLLDGVPQEDTNLGLNLGVTGEFDLVKSWSFVAELAGHVVFSDYAELFATAHAGLVCRF